MSLDLKTTTTKFSYRVEPKPEGGFRAIPSDSGMAVIEGSTREEVNEKIRAKLGEMIVAQFPISLKIGGIPVTINTKFNLWTRKDARPGITDSNPNLNRFQNASELYCGASPIVPVANTGKAFRFVITSAGIGVLVYFLLHLFHR
jgi:hypothetical protein